jgi:hypothetical protein
MMLQLSFVHMEASYELSEAELFRADWLDVWKISGRKRAVRYYSYH